MNKYKMRDETILLFMFMVCFTALMLLGQIKIQVYTPVILFVIGYMIGYKKKSRELIR
jgi:predicted membrane protein